MTTEPGLASILGITFNSPELLETALTHRSYLNENRQVKLSNERLEFLGDSVLSLIVSTKLYRDFDSYPEGKLTSLRSALVRAKTLAAVAQKLDLGRFLLVSRGEEASGGRENKSLLADTLEAIIGAIYLDQGLSVCEAFLTRVLFPLIPEIEKSSELMDYKSTLQEEIQEKFRLSPHYLVIEESGPDHAKLFKVGVFIKEKQLAEGQGKSKQEAEQEAARLALEKAPNFS